MNNTVIMFRPVGSAELKLIEDSGFKTYPPRLPDQPIFYPVLNEAYARQIAKDWNSKLNDDKVGYVTRFAVKTETANKYKPEVVGAKMHEEIWVPAEELDEFNAAIVGKIEVIVKYSEDKLVWKKSC